MVLRILAAFFEDVNSMTGMPIIGLIMSAKEFNFGTRIVVKCSHHVA